MHVSSLFFASTMKIFATTLLAFVADGTGVVNCSAPTAPTRAGGKDCPQSCTGGRGGHCTADCLNGNLRYDDLSSAWNACAGISGCGAVMDDTDGGFYLRRSSDPDRHDDTPLYVYSCAASCPTPSAPTSSRGKMCPQNAHANCLNDNKRYDDLSSAWNACAGVSGCGAVMGDNGGFYLRRSTDPDTHDTTLFVYSCTSPSNCPAPTAPTHSYGKACPQSCSGGRGGPHCTTDCLNGNMRYDDLSSAWNACAGISGCGAVMGYTDGGFYLRRSNDPDWQDEKRTLYMYSCLAGNSTNQNTPHVFI